MICIYKNSTRFTFACELGTIEWDCRFDSVSFSFFQHSESILTINSTICFLIHSRKDSFPLNMAISLIM